MTETDIQEIFNYVKSISSNRLVTFPEVVENLTKEYGGQVVRAALWHLIANEKLFINDNNYLQTHSWKPYVKN